MQLNTDIIHHETPPTAPTNPSTWMTAELDTTAMNAPDIVDASLLVDDISNTKICTSGSLSQSPIIAALKEQLCSYIAKENK